MLSVISPAKRLDFSDSTVTDVCTTPVYVDESSELISKLKKLSSEKIGDLMSINKDLSELNYARYQDWTPTFTGKNSKQAILAFSGEVYRGIDAKTFDKKDFGFAQDHLRILSGLHGLLRPLDMIHPHRLEMGTKIKIGRNKNLYAFWDRKISDDINELIQGHSNKVLVNLASNEYFRAVDTKLIDATVVTPVFKDYKNGQYKAIMTYAKVARGLMTRHIIQNKIEDVEGIRTFKADGYSFNKGMSSADELVFTRKAS